MDNSREKLEEGEKSMSLVSLGGREAGGKCPDH